jgi:hypothetical protein
VRVWHERGRIFPVDVFGVNQGWPVNGTAVPWAQLDIDSYRCGYAQATAASTASGGRKRGRPFVFVQRIPRLSVKRTGPPFVHFGAIVYRATGRRQPSRLRGLMPEVENVVKIRFYTSGAFLDRCGQD